MRENGMKVRQADRLTVLLAGLSLLLAVAEASADSGRKPQVQDSQTKEVKYLVEVLPWADATTIAAAAGMEVVWQSKVNESWYFMRDLQEAPPAGALAGLRAIPGVSFAVAGSRVRRTRSGFVPNDPYFAPLGGGWANPGQWYLANSHVPDLDINVSGAWDRGITGSGVTVGMVDDGLETRHPDLSPNYRPGLSWNFGDDTSDPNPFYSDEGHGVSIAGIAAARGGNGLGGTGVAPYAGLAGLKVDFWLQEDRMFADATLYRTDAIKVKNHSYSIPWGYIGDDILVAANRQAAADGVINVRAAGNERDNANARALQADRTALAVAALSIDGHYSYYSNFGACVFVTAPSSDTAGHPAITTTDRMGPLGYSDGSNPTFPDSDYTNMFGGTSAPTAMVSGAVAAILQVNPNLDIRGIKHVLARTSRMVDPAHPKWITNAAGYHFNPNYGFGLIDVDAATRLAAAFTPPAIEISYTTGLVEVTQTVPDDNPVGVTATFEMSGSAPLETVEVAFRFTHPYPGDLDITLTSPSGTSSRLAYVYTWSDYMVDWDTGETLPLDWTFSSVAFWGEDAGGTWSLRVSDEWVLYEGTWDTFAFTAYAGLPEPATLLLLALGGVVLIRRKRRASS